jgi:hypothetical protein
MIYGVRQLLQRNQHTSARAVVGSNSADRVAAEMTGLHPEADVLARALAVAHASLPVILSLIDQLHDARHHLRTLTRAVAEQPEPVQQEITRRIGGGSESPSD